MVSRGHGVQKLGLLGVLLASKLLLEVNTLAQELDGREDDGGRMSRVGESLIRWNISPITLQKMRSEGFKRQFSPWGGKRAVLDQGLASSQRLTLPRPFYGSALGSKAAKDMRKEGFPNDETFNPWGGKRENDKEKDLSFNPWGGKRQSTESSFNPWGGKRDDPFNPWGGKKGDGFSPWAGKRTGSFNPWGGKRNTADNPFTPWGGKRERAFSPWAGKKSAFSALGGRVEEDAFAPWPGKRDDNFNPWGGKKEDKDNSFSPWGGKRDDPFNPWGGKKESFKSSGVKKEDKAFNPWGGKRDGAWSVIPGSLEGSHSRNQ